MKRSLALAFLLLLVNLGFGGRWSAEAPPQERPPRGDREGRGRPLFGKISAIGSDSIEITQPDGNKVSLKLTSSTQFRKDREPAKAADFKVGDPVVVRTDPADGKGTTALLVASGPFGNGPGGFAGGGFAGGMTGTLGKDYVVGEIKAVDPPRLTVLRTDHVTQTLELNEETSLRRGRDSITMADISAGDHVVARGAMANEVFVPKNLNVFSAEQWKRVEEMMAGRGAGPSAPGAAPAPGAPSSPNAPASPPSPPEPQN